MNNYVKLGDLIKSVSQTHKFDKDELVFLNTSDVFEGKILIDNYMPISEMKGQAKKSIKNGDILYSEIRPKNRRYAYVKGVKNIEDYVVSTKLMVLRNNSESLDTNYLYHFLTSQEAINYLQNRAENRIGSFPQITFEIVQSLSIWLPDLPAQQKIAAVLSALDDKIELNNKINAELEAMAKTLYDYWFVQFDFPNEDGKPYKSSGGKMVYNSILKREIPEGWEVKRLGCTLKTYLGGTPSTSNERFWNGDIPWMNSGEVINFPLIETAQKITNEAVEQSSTRYLKKGSVILSITRHLRVNILAIDACINQSIAGVEENEHLKNSYIYFHILNDIERLMKLRTGAQQPHINKDIVDNSPFLIPNQQILDYYYSKVDLIFKRIIVNAKQNQELAQLRDWLLPMLMNRQVTVAEVEVEEYDLGKVQTQMAVEPELEYHKESIKEDRFQLWVSTQKAAARGDIDEVVLREIFDAMDDEDK